MFFRRLITTKGSIAVDEFLALAFIEDIHNFPYKLCLFIDSLISEFAKGAHPEIKLDGGNYKQKYDKQSYKPDKVGKVEKNMEYAYKRKPDHKDETENR